MKTYSGWLIPADVRAVLLKYRPPRFPIVRLHHVTHIFGQVMPLKPATVSIEGYATDQDCECYAVSVNGEFCRPDGELYHLTISRTERVSSAHAIWVVRNRPWLLLEPNRFTAFPMIFQ